MLASNIGIAANTHFCGGEAVERTISLGFEHLDCGMAEVKAKCSENDENEQLRPKPCCENQHELLQLDDEFDAKQSASQVNKTFLAAFIHTFIDQIFSPVEKSTSYLNYSPPILEQDVQILFQTFLI